MVSDAINQAFQKKYKRGWDKWPKMYWAIDLHGVIIKPYRPNLEVYPVALEVLKWLSGRKDMYLILFTCTEEQALQKYGFFRWCCNNEIVFDAFNENPEVVSNGLLNVEKKFYYDILLEDKAGFVGEEDWQGIKDALIILDEWHKNESHEERK